MKNRNEILEEVQDEGLAILKLHEKLNEFNIDHKFINRKEEQERLYKVKSIYPFDYQIIVMEDEKEISLMQGPFSCGITSNLIEIYNFNQEPITMWYIDAFKFIKHKCLNKYICYINKLNADSSEDSKEMREEFHNFIKIIMESEEN